MAGEKKGKAYEALVHVALLELVAEGKLAGPVHWNVTPTGMSIEPDFITGSDPNNPKTLLLLSHCASVKNSDMKMWRNLGELVEAKTMLPTMPRVYCLTFGIIKTDLEPIQQHAFDQFVWVRQGTHPWVDDLDELICACLSDFPKGQEAQTVYMRSKQGKATADRKVACQRLKSLLEALYKGKSAELDNMWSDHRSRVPPVAQGARDTFFRRGIGKLLPLDNQITIDGEGRTVGPIKQDSIDLLETLEFGRKTVGGARITDSEIVWAVRNIPRRNIDILMEARNIPRVAEWIETLRNLHRIKPQLEFIERHWERLITPQGMFDSLKLCHRSPHKLCPQGAAEGSKRVWLFHAVSELIKINSGSRTSFGLAFLMGILDRKKAVRQHREVVRAMVRREVEWHAPETIRLGLQDWQSAGSEQSFAFTDEDLARVSCVLAEMLSLVPKPNAMRDTGALIKATIQTVLEAKLLTYRGFDPIGSILSTTISSTSGEGPRYILTQACFAEATATSGVKIDPRSSGTEVVVCKNTMINWQSCSDAGRDHKKKELCGRAIGLRYHWNGNAFVRRPGVKKMILVLDGTWKQADLNALIRSGWDEICYPDEIDALKKAIV